MRKQFKRRFPRINQGVAQTKGIAIFVFLRLHGSFLAFMTEPPAPLVRSLMNGDTIQPGLQAGFTIETLHSTEYLEEHLLGGVRRIRWVAQDAVHKAVNRLVIMCNEPVVGLL